MALTMDEETFLQFYKNTVLGLSKNQQKQICKLLENQQKITFKKQRSLGDSEDALYFENKSEIQNIIQSTTTNKSFLDFYEQWEYIRLYKYSVPLFFEGCAEEKLKGLSLEALKWFVPENNELEYSIDTSIKDVVPTCYQDDGKFLVKFVLQKSYYSPDELEPTDYRYPVIIYLDNINKIAEVRYDSLKYSGAIESATYFRFVDFCIQWLKTVLKIELYICEYPDIIEVINDKGNESVKIYKQMMELSTGGSAELTASEDRDYILPFVGEIRELIDENKELFDEAEEVKQLLLQYLIDKEDTASYPYIYVKWLTAVESDSYIVKIIFDYFNNRFTLLQHITGNCKDLGMERMNNAIEYLFESGSFNQGEKI